MTTSEASTPLLLYGYWRSSASYRVRIALNLKAVSWRQKSVHLVRDGGQQHSAEYRALNPQAQVPTLIDGELTLTQSPAILEYLDEKYPAPALLPADLAGRARVRALAAVITCDTHPLNNLAVLNYLVSTLNADEAAKLAWYRHWVKRGLDAFEQLLATHPDTGACCHGDQPGLADCCLIPQVYNARRFECDETGWPTIRRICEHLSAHPAFAEAAPENQPDAE
ncbi:MAG: maleylacetoacetate isomerase [Wenzhouxiangellaceae bacterium]